MKIAVIAQLNHPVAAPFKGGLESHTWWLVKKMQTRGHDVTLFASGDSDASLPLCPVRAHCLFADETFKSADGPSWRAKFNRFLRNRASNAAYAIATKAIREEKFDIVHNNSISAKPLKDAKNYRAPVVTVLHTPVFREILQGVKAAKGRSEFIAVSEYLADHWSRFADATVIHNGSEASSWRFSESAEPGTAIWFGRIARTKAPHLAIRAAVEAGYRLDLYGGIDDRDYYDREVAPLLSLPGIAFHGSVDHATLNEKLGAASVMICTPLWDEPFGLTVTEALACGTPVASFAGGAVGEILTRETGRIVPKGDISALAAGLAETAGLSRQSCRRRFDESFSMDRMVEAYESFYRKMKCA